MNPDDSLRFRAAGPWLMIAALCAGLAGPLAGCGQRGPLYLPEDPPPAAAQPPEEVEEEEDDPSDEKTS
jgi:predicted small lipoprotein YifL